MLGAVAEDPDGPDDNLLRLGRGRAVEAPHQRARDALGVEQDGVLVVVVGHVGDGPHAPGLSFGDEWFQDNKQFFNLLEILDRPK